MPGPIASGLPFALLVSLSPVVALLGCSGGDSSSSSHTNGADAAGSDGGTGSGGNDGGGGGPDEGASPADGASNDDAATSGDSAAPDAPGAEGSASDGGSAVDGGGAEAGDGGPKVIAHGPYAIAYTSLPGTDSNERSSVTATFSSAGVLTGYVYSAGAEAPTIGTNTASEAYMDSISALGRWSGGTAGGAYFSSTLTWTADQGFHYAIGVPTPSGSFPTTGSTAMNLLAATKPTVYPNVLSPGAVTDGSAQVTWGATTATIALTLSVTTSAGDYTIATTSGGGMSNHVVDPVSWGGSAPATGTGPACAGSSCVANFEGFIAGGAGERLGCVFIITSGGTAYTVRGAALFGKP
jgi:hypothetical protein